MLAQTWPPVTYWLTADDRMIATAVDLLADLHPDQELDDE